MLPTTKALQKQCRDTVKAYVKEKGLMCSGELPDAVSDAVRFLLDKACERTKENKRSTVRKIRSAAPRCSPPSP